MIVQNILRRNPWVARKTVKWKQIPQKKKSYLIYEFIGYYPLTALVEYNKDPYNLHAETITFEEIYNKWSERKFTEISKSNIKGYYRYYVRPSSGCCG